MSEKTNGRQEIDKFWQWFIVLAWYWKTLILIFFWWIIIPLYIWTRTKWPTATKIAASIVMMITLIALAIGNPDNNTGPQDINRVEDTETIKVKPVKPRPKITYETTETTEAIPFVEQHIQDSNLDKGKSELRQEGVNGVKTKYYKITLRDGIKANRVFEKEIITVTPIDKITAEGTKEPPPPPQPQTPPPSPVVYITKTGKRYHQAHPDGCHSYLSRSKIPISLTQAEAQGYTPCQCSSCSW